MIGDENMNLETLVNDISNCQCPTCTNMQKTFTTNTPYRLLLGLLETYETISELPTDLRDEHYLWITKLQAAFFLGLQRYNSLLEEL